MNTQETAPISIFRTEHISQNYNYIHSHLIVLLHSVRRHSVYDRVPTWIHIRDCDANGQQREDENNAEP